MREVKVLKWCDFCAAVDDGRTEATATYTVAISTGERIDGAHRVLEVCEVHAKGVLDFAAQVRDVGVVTTVRNGSAAALADAKTGVSGQLVPCPECGVDLTNSGVVGHLRTQHLGQRGQRPALTVCPECDQHYPTPQGLGYHRKAVHGTSALTDALAEVAARKAAKPRPRKAAAK